MIDTQVKECFCGRECAEHLGTYCPNCGEWYCADCLPDDGREYYLAGRICDNCVESYIEDRERMR